MISFCIRSQNVRNSNGLIVKLLTTNLKGNEKGSYESTNEDPEEVYVMNRFYYHYDDEYDKDSEEDVNKEDRRNEYDENSDEFRVDGNNDKNEDYGNNDKQDDVSR